MTNQDDLHHSVEEIGILTAVLGDVANERGYQDAKWGPIENFDDRSPDRWMTILMEEVGELAEAIYEKETKHAQEEATQVAAVAVAIIQSLDRKSIEEREQCQTKKPV